MRSGKLRYRVSVQDRTETVDEKTGAITHTWATERTVYANVEPLSGRERMEAQQVQADTSYKITMRYFDGLNAGMRILRPAQWRELNGDIDDTTTSVTINAAFDRATTDDFYARIESEEVLVTAGHSSTGLTVTRGAHTTTAASHLSGVSVCEMWPLEVIEVRNTGTAYRELVALCAEVR